MCRSSQLNQLCTLFYQLYKDGTSCVTMCWTAMLRDGREIPHVIDVRQICGGANPTRPELDITASFRAANIARVVSDRTHILSSPALSLIRYLTLTDACHNALLQVCVPLQLLSLLLLHHLSTFILRVDAFGCRFLVRRLI